MKQKLFYFFLVLIFPGFMPSGYSQYYMEDRWPNLKFNLPVGMYTAPDQSKRIFVLEQTGKIIVFKDSGTVNQSDTSGFLNLRSRMPNGIGGGSEFGLLGMAFHPDFAQNGYVFVNYTRPGPLTTYVSRFKVSPNNPNRLDRASEKVLLQIPQPFSNHNGGAIIFGDDGYLYVATGDGGSAGDPGNRAQNKTDLLGKILRIDVNVPDGGPAYAIPVDNPFAGNSQGWKQEIGCHGMRNPWKISKDPETKTIWIADVGQNAIEEVDTFRLGANYGWKVTEGNNAYSACGSCDTSNYEKPVWTYNRSLGYSVTGGFVYRGNELFRLKGNYICGDYGSQRIWALRRNGNQFTPTEIGTAGGAISSFGLDNENELYAIRYSATNGKLMKIRCGPATPVLAALPKTEYCSGDSVVLMGPAGAQIAGYKWSSGDTIRRVVFKAPGTYSITLQSRNTFGCYSYASNTIRFSIRANPPQPQVNTVVGCEGNATIVPLPTQFSYLWTNGPVNGQISVPASGNYWILAVDSSSCKSDTTFFNASFSPTPATPSIIQTGANLSVSGISGGTYQWLLNGSPVQTSADTFLTVSSPGAYQVVALAPSGCRSDTSQIFTVTRVAQRIKDIPLVVSPNPFGDVLEFTWTENDPGHTAVVELVDARGATVFTEKVRSIRKGTRFKANTESIPKGAYTVKVTQGARSVSHRVVKQ